MNSFQTNVVFLSVAQQRKKQNEEANAGRQPEKGKIIASTDGFLPAAWQSRLCAGHLKDWKLTWKILKA